MDESLRFSRAVFMTDEHTDSTEWWKLCDNVEKNLEKAAIVASFIIIIHGIQYICSH